MSKEQIKTPDGKVTVWRSRFGTQQLLDGNKKVLYYEDVAFYVGTFSIAAFIGATGLSWLINIDAFPRPPFSDNLNVSSNFFTHLGFWAKGLIGKVLPFAFKSSIHQYHSYIDLLSRNDMFYTLYARIYFGLFAGAYGAWRGLLFGTKNPINAEITVHKRGMQVYRGVEAEDKLRPLLQEEITQTGKFAELSTELNYSVFRLIRHFIIFGASGTGKSQFMMSSIVSAIDQGLKSFILDPKFEFTSALYKENNGSNAILDPTDKRSHVWAIWYDLKSIGLMKKFAAAIIPKGGDNPMWSNAARSVFVGMLVYLQQNFKDEDGKPNYGWSDISDMITLPPNELVHVMKNFYPEALSLIGELDASTGNVTTNVTTAGIMINLLSFMGGIRDLARFWHDRSAPQVSLFRFMADPEYPIKTLFVKPNDVEAEMSTGLVRAMCIYAISLLDSPNIKNTKTPKGAFFLDEFHAPGKLLNEVDQPVIDKLIDRGRSKGWAAFLATQNIIQLYKIYSKEDVNSWRETTSSFILTGAPLGETATAVCDFLGEQFIDKLHTSMTRQPDGANTTLNYQEHNRKVMLPSELSSELNPTKTGIRLLALLRGMPDVYILDKPYVDIPELVPHWIEREQRSTAVNPNSRARALIAAQMSGQVQIIPERPSQLSAVDALERELYENSDGDYEDYGQDADPMSQEESDFMATNTKIHDITEQEEVSIASDVAKDHMVEAVTDSHGISMAVSVVEALMTPGKKVTTSKSKYEEIKARKEQQQLSQRMK